MADQQFWHVNPETGKPGRCSATKQACRFVSNGVVPDHYENKQDAIKAGEMLLQKKHGSFPSTVSAKKKDMRNHPSFGKLNDEIEMDKPFSIDADGNVVQLNVRYTESPADDAEEINGDVVSSVPGWEPVTGFTNREGYDGPLMGREELLSGGAMEEYMRNNPGNYIVVHPINNSPRAREMYSGKWVVYKDTGVAADKKKEKRVFTPEEREKLLQYEYTDVEKTQEIKVLDRSLLEYEDPDAPIDPDLLLSLDDFKDISSSARDAYRDMSDEDQSVPLPSSRTPTIADDEFLDADFGDDEYEDTDPFVPVPDEEYTKVEYDETGFEKHYEMDGDSEGILYRNGEEVGTFTRDDFGWVSAQFNDDDEAIRAKEYMREEEGL